MSPLKYRHFFPARPVACVDQGPQEGDVLGHGATVAADDASAGGNPAGDVASAGLGVEVVAVINIGPVRSIGEKVLA